MIKLAEEIFDARNDPAQISVTEEIIARLRTIHPATVTEARNEKGPIAWMLVIPTTIEVMSEFLQGAINERELLERTPVPGRYEALYLCSALVLPEERRKGLAARLVRQAIASIRRDHPISSLFTWPFTNEGDRLAEAVARDAGLVLFKRPT